MQIAVNAFIEMTLVMYVFIKHKQVFYKMVFSDKKDTLQVKANF